MAVIALAIVCGPFVGVARATPGAAAAAGLLGSRPDPEDVPTKLSFSLYLVDIDSIEDLRQEFTADLYLVLRWRDPRLALPDGSGGEAQRILPLAQIWQPELGILNQRGLRASLPQTARVDAQGNVESAQRLRGQFASPLDLRRFPFDRQELAIQFISYRYSSDELEIEADRVLRLESFSVSGWRIGQPVSEAAPLEIPSVTGRAGLTVRVEAEREKAFYLLTLVLPLTLIALMAWSVLWIDPPLLPARPAISSASIITLIAFRLSLMWSLPKLSYLTIGDSFVIAVTVLVFGALGETVIAGRMAKSGRETQAQTLDRWARWIYAAVLLALCLTVLILA